MRRSTIVLVVLICICVAFAAAPADAKEILVANVADPISPAMAEFIDDALAQATPETTECVIITLDTPGGLVESMRKIVQSIYNSPVPVVVYVSPSGARAASAGVMITLAADVAAMAPGTNIGAAHPVGTGGKEINETMATKAVNDLVAFTKGIAERRGRNTRWAEEAVRKSVSITDDEALSKKVIDLIAKDLDDLIGQLDGRQVAEKGTLALKGLPIRNIQETLRTKILKTISDPNIAYILMMIGMAGLYFELSNPGAIFPGVLGGIALILAFFSLQTLPVNSAGILLILLAVIFFILELKITSYGMLSVAGVLSLVLGSLMLFKGAGPHFQVAWRVMLPTVFLISAFFVVLAYLVFRAHSHKAYTGTEGLVNEVGLVKQVDGAIGKVLVHGELWQASFAAPVSEGERVRVKEVRDLVITVAPLAREIDGTA